MSLAVPSALLLAAIALPIIALYILKVRLRRVKVSTNLFWKQIYDDKPPRAWWQNLRHLVSLLAQLLLLLLLVLAVADPYFSWQASQAKRIVVVMDTSASMLATDISPTRFDAARASVHRLLDGLRFRDEVAIVSAGPQPEVVLGMVSHIPTLRRAIDSLQPTDTASSSDAAIQLAERLIGEHANGQVHVFSDGCAHRPAVAEVARLWTSDSEIDSPVVAEVDKPSPSDPISGQISYGAETDTASLSSESTDDIQVVFHTLATNASNVGITQFQARRSLIDPVGYEVLVTIRNAADVAVQGRLELELDEIPIDVIPLDLKPNETWTRSLEKTSLPGGLLHGKLTQLASSDQAEGEPSVNLLQTDDVAWAIVPPRAVKEVLIVTPGNLFLRKVFEANPLVNVNVVNALPMEWPVDTLVVLHRIIPEKLPSGQLLVVDPESNSDTWTLGEVIENPIITEQDQDSPLMTHIRLDNVLLPEARRIDFNEPAKTLVATVTGETVYTQLNRSAGTCLVLSVNLERSDLAFRTAFPIMITNALNWFAGRPSELQPSLAGGQMAKLDDHFVNSENLATGQLAPGAEVTAARPVDEISIRELGLRLVSPAGDETPIVSQQVGPLNKVGLWDIVRTRQVDGVDEVKPLQQVAVNLADSNESDLRPVEGAIESMAGETTLTSVWLSRPAWYYLVLAATIFCALEWSWYQRRVIA